MWTKSVLWVDAAGFAALTRINTVAGLPGPAFSALLACSEADWQQSWESVLAAQVPVPPGGVYASVADRALLTFVCADNTTTGLLIPAPALSIFMADGETVDPTAPEIVALVAGITGVLTNAAGSPVTALVAGNRVARTRLPLKG